MTESRILALQGLELSYDIDGREFEVLRGLDLEVKDHDLVFIQGELGTGKSALINILAGLELPVAGTIELGGIDLSALSEAESKPLFDSFVGCFAPWFRMESHLSAAQILLDYRRSPRQDPEIIAQILDLDLDDPRPMSRVDCYTRRRLDCARILLRGPRLIVADLVTPPWGSAPELHDILRIHETLGLPIVATVAHEVEVPKARNLHLIDGRLTKNLACA